MRNEIKLNKNDKAFKDILVTIISQNIDKFKNNLIEEFDDLKFDNLELLIPESLQDYIEKEIQAFLFFLTTQDISLCLKRGAEAGNVRISGRIIISLFNAFFNSFSDLIPASNSQLLKFAYKITSLYMQIYESAFTQYRDKKLYSNQEQLYSSLIRTISRQQAEIAEKERQIQEAKIEALKEQHQQKTDFLINFSHEIKHPLSLIEYTLIELRKEAGNRKLYSLDSLESYIKELRTLSLNILDYEKIMHGSMLYDHTRKTNVSAVVQSMAQLYKRPCTTHNIELSMDIEEDLYSKIDSNALHRILSNLLDNAMKYNEEQGLIHIEVKRNNKVIIIMVKDSGIGISPEHLPHIFEPYFQSNYQIKDNRGVGMGLALVKGILNEAAGTIKINSKKGEGTEVILTLKQTKLTKIKKKNITEEITFNNPQIYPPKSLEPEKYDIHKPIVFLIEDKKELLFYLQTELIKDFNFYYAMDGMEALQKLPAMPAKPDIIISDIIMHNMDGYELCSRIKKKKELLGIPFIFLTAKTTAEEKIKGLRHGAMDYIEKPVNIAVLREKIYAFLRNRDDQVKQHISKMAKALKQRDSLKPIIPKDWDFLIKRYRLTKKEREYITLLLKGYKNKEIAERLNVSKNTVRTHIYNIFTKCEVNSKHELLAIFQTK